MSLYINYKNFSDLSKLVADNDVIPSLDFDVVVGIPRSGIPPAAMIALHWNKPFAALDDFSAGRVFGHGRTRGLPGFNEDARHYKRALIVDDSVDTGNTILEARERLSQLQCEKTFLAVFAHRRSEALVDRFLERVSMPRIFEWNMWHHREFCARACFDLDGVLCNDPTEAENDDGPRYRAFLSGVRCLVVPTLPLAHIVTSRLERYRPETEAWLAEKGIRYRHLHMLDMPSAEARRRAGAHAPFKAEIYAGAEADLFVESDPEQARMIARLSGKPALDYANRRLVRPDELSLATLQQKQRTVRRRAFKRLKRIVARTLG